MRRIKAIFLLLACCLLMAVPFRAAAAQKKGWDSTKTYYYIKQDGKLVKATGLQKIGSYYYFFSKKGVVQKNKWKKNLAVDGKRYTFYFGANGRAYQAKANEYFSSSAVKLFKIDKINYAFDEKAHMVTGFAVTSDDKMYYFDSKGVYNAAKAKKGRALTKIGTTSKTMLRDVRSLFGKPKKIDTTDSCNYFDIKEGEELPNGASYTGYLYTYKNIVISITRNDKTKVYHMDGAGALMD